MSMLKQQYPIERMSKVLQVSRSGYYRYLKRSNGKQALKNQMLTKHIKTIFCEHKRRYGSPRIHQELKDQGIFCSKKTVAKIMQEQELQAYFSKKKRRTKPAKQVKRPNLLEQNFFAHSLNAKWVSDITQIKTKTGWVYVCAVMDLCSRRIISHSVSEHVTQDLVLTAIKEAVSRRKGKKGLIFHSDQGSQYTATTVQELLAKLGFISSMSGKGSCYDNAVIESFWSTLKRECIQGKMFEDALSIKLATFSYIEGYYNKQRKHATLGYVSPIIFEKKNCSSMFRSCLS